MKSCFIVSGCKEICRAYGALDIDFTNHQRMPFLSIPQGYHPSVSGVSIILLETMGNAVLLQQTSTKKRQFLSINGRNKH